MGPHIHTFSMGFTNPHTAPKFQFSVKNNNSKDAMQCAMCCTRQFQFVVFDGCTCTIAPDKLVCHTCAQKAVEHAYSYTCMFCRQPFSGATKAHVSTLVPDKLQTTAAAWSLPPHKVRPPDEAQMDTLLPSSDFPMWGEDGEILSEDDDTDSDADSEGNLAGFIVAHDDYDMDAAIADVMLQHLLAVCK